MKQPNQAKKQGAGKKKVKVKTKKFATGGGEQTDLVLERPDHHKDSAVPQNTPE